MYAQLFAGIDDEDGLDKTLETMQALRGKAEMRSYHRQKLRLFHRTRQEPPGCGAEEAGSTSSSVIFCSAWTVILKYDDASARIVSTLLVNISTVSVYITYTSRKEAVTSMNQDQVFMYESAQH